MIDGADMMITILPLLHSFASVNNWLMIHCLQFSLMEVSTRMENINRILLFRRMRRYEPTLLFMQLYISREAAKATPGNISQGPVYNAPDSIGKQADSRKANSSAFGYASFGHLHGHILPKISPSLFHSYQCILIDNVIVLNWMNRYRFGTSSRPSVTNKNHAGDPGPGAYKSPGSVAPQMDSRKKNSESAVFGTSTRDQMQKQAVESKEREQALYGVNSPPPNLYSLRGSIGVQNLSTKSNLPNTRIGTAPRFPRNDADEVPGAGHYKAPDSVGKQYSSRRRNAALPGFGTSTRENCAKVFISHEHGKVAANGVSPGPTTADPYHGVGKQNISTRRTAPASGFGTSKVSLAFIPNKPLSSENVQDVAGEKATWLKIAICIAPCSLSSINAKQIILNRIICCAYSVPSELIQSPALTPCCFHNRGRTLQG